MKRHGGGASGGNLVELHGLRRDPDVRGSSARGAAIEERIVGLGIRAAPVEKTHVDAGDGDIV